MVDKHLLYYVVEQVEKHGFWKFIICKDLVDKVVRNIKQKPVDIAGVGADIFIFNLTQIIIFLYNLNELFFSCVI